MDEIELAKLGVAAYVSKELMLKLFGDSAVYLGGELRGFIEKCNINLGSIFNNAAKKLGSRLEAPGTVSPRILKHVLDDGRFCEDTLTIEYYGGILASSKSDFPRDDRAVSVLSVVRDLSTYQIRMHYVIYAILHRVYERQNYHHLHDEGGAGILISSATIIEAMDFSDEEDIESIINHSIIGLEKNGLIDHIFEVGVPYPGPLQDGKPIFGVHVKPSYFGVELYMWANGIPNVNAIKFYDISIPEMANDVKLAEGYQSYYG